LIFEIEMILCERFPGLNPLQLDEYRAVEVFEMVRDLNTYIDNQNAGKTQGQISENKKKTHMVKVMN